MCVKVGILAPNPVLVVDFDLDINNQPRLVVSDYSNNMYIKNLTEAQVDALTVFGIFTDNHIQSLINCMWDGALSTKVMDNTEYAYNDIHEGYGKKVRNFLESSKLVIRRHQLPTAIISESKNHLELNARQLESMSFEEIYNLIGGWVQKNLK
jgi:hypothetical protein